MSAARKVPAKAVTTTSIRVIDLQRLEERRGRLSKVEMHSMLLDIYDSLSPTEQAEWKAKMDEPHPSFAVAR